MLDVQGRLQASQVLWDEVLSPESPNVNIDDSVEVSLPEMLGNTSQKRDVATQTDGLIVVS
jgi:hypothetical protein